MKPTHYFGIPINGQLTRFSRSVDDDEFIRLTANGLPPGWVAWHIPDGETVDTSERCRELAKLPIVILDTISNELLSLPVPASGPIESPWPTPHPADILSQIEQKITQEKAKGGQ